MGQTISSLWQPPSPPGPLCPLCACLRSFYRYEFEDFQEKGGRSEIRSDLDKNIDMLRRKFFHSECNEDCSSSREGEDASCEICNHFQFRHLIRCVFTKTAKPRRRGNTWHGIGLIFDLGTLEDVRDRAETCRTCQMLMEPVAWDAKTSPSAPVELFIDLEKQSFSSDKYSFRMGIRLTPDVSSHSRPALLDGDMSMSVYPYRWAGLAATPTPKVQSVAGVRRPEPFVPWEIASKWLQECDSNHERCPRKKKFTLPPGFRLIDVQKGAVTAMSDIPRYATLSYVWGSDANHDLQAVKSNISELEVSGYLLGNQAVPETIRDAMVACSQLGIPYLWVDRFCIVQDDEETKKAQINAMASIYGSSCVTIAQLEGTGAHSGLSGVTTQRPPATPSYNIGGVLFMLEYDNYNAVVRRSKWATRGWTMQEAFCSPRLLLFSDQGAFFECHGATNGTMSRDRLRMEDHKMREYKLVNMGVLSPFMDIPYSNLVNAFLVRDMTLDSDVLNAFNGMLQHIYGSNHYYGIPIDELRKFILWYSRGEMTARTPGKGDIFPSWSWASVKTKEPIEFHSELAGNEASFALWTLVSKDSSLRVLPHRPRYKVTKAEKDHNQDPDQALGSLTVLMAWKSKCFPEKIPLELSINGNWQQYLDAICTKWPTPDNLCNQAFGIDPDTLIPSPDLLRSFQPHVEKAKEPGRILVYTNSVTLCLQPSSGPNGNFMFFAEDGNQCLTLDSADENSKKTLETYAKYSNVQLDLLAIHFGSTDAEKEIQHEWHDSDGTPLHRYSYQERVFEVTPNPTHAQSVKVFLMIVHTMEGISKRVALGEVNLKDWVKLERQFRTFVLA